MTSSTTRPFLSLSLASPSSQLPTTTAVDDNDIENISTPSSYQQQQQQQQQPRRTPSWGSENGSSSFSSSSSTARMEGLPSPVSSMRGAHRNWEGFAGLQQQGSSRESIGRWGSFDDAAAAPSDRLSLGEAVRSLQSFNVSTGTGSRSRAPSQSISTPGSSTSTHSKTSSFFDADAHVVAISPPPNPLVRGGSLRTNWTGPSLVKKRDAKTTTTTTTAATMADNNDNDDDVDAATMADPVLARRSTVGGSSSRGPRRNHAQQYQQHAPPPRLPDFADFASPSSLSSSLFRTFPNFHSSYASSSVPPDHAPSGHVSVTSSPLGSGPTPTDDTVPRSSSVRFLDLANSGSSRSSSAAAALMAAEEDEPIPHAGEVIGEFEVVKSLGKGAFSRVALAKKRRSPSLLKQEPGVGEEGEGGGGRGALVALKIISKKGYDVNQRKKTSVMREVEVLQHVHHPSLVSLSSSFSTPTHTVLVLDYAPGGELFDFLAVWHRNITEALARRLFGELCSAVGWMHSIGLVHRDIKLENILLMSHPFPSTLSSSALLSSLPTPFLKLADFGLSRFIDPTSPLLSTRCGSEAYAAPELLMGKQYDGRQTDAWALGVVLFAVIAGEMPFKEEAASAGKRRAYLIKVAKAQYTWPSSHQGHGGGGASMASEAVQRLVGRLLVRDPEKRATVEDIWQSEWMQGEGRPERVQGWISSGTGQLRVNARREMGDEEV